MSGCKLFWTIHGEAAKTAAGFFWKSGWAFVLGYTISASVQALVSKERPTKHMGDAGLGSIGLATTFGTISSSCSFAALAAARALVSKGAHFVAAVAFIFASTNAVIELGILRRGTKVGNVALHNDHDRDQGSCISSLAPVI